MALQTKINFNRVEEITNEFDQPGLKWWLKRIVDTVRYIFTSQGRAFGLASATVAVAVALGAAAGLATAIAAPAVILPIIAVGVGIGIRRQYKRHQRLKELSANVKVSRAALKERIHTLITEEKLAYGLEYVFEPFEGNNIEEKLQNIFGTDNKPLEYENWIINYNLMLKRKDVLKTFFEKHGHKKIEDVNQQNQINILIDSLDEIEYRENQDAINTFFNSGNNAWLHDRELPGPKKASLLDIAPEIMPTLPPKRWYNYLIEAARDIITAIVSVGTVFGLIAGIAVIAGVSVGTGGMGLVVLIIAAVLGLAVGIGIFAVKKYIHDKEKTDVNNLDNVNDTCNKIVHTMNDLKVRSNEKSCEEYLGVNVDSAFLENFEREFALSTDENAKSFEADSSAYSTPLGSSFRRSKKSAEDSSEASDAPQSESSSEDESVNKPKA